MRKTRRSIALLFTLVILVMSGCVFPPFYEPYPAMTYREITIEDTPPSIRQQFEQNFPNGIIHNIEQEYFKEYLRGYVIFFEVHDAQEQVFITSDGTLIK